MADMTDATKRKEPEVEKAVAGGEKVVAAAEPDAKRPKVAAKPVDPAVIRKQVEYYLSDENLRTDRFFSEKIASDKEGWLEMSLLLSCNKMKAMRATQDDVMASLKDSKLELKDGGAAVRRPGNTPLPKLESKPQYHQKKTMHAHDGGVISVFKGIPAEQSWVQLKEALTKKLPPKVAPWYVSEVNDKTHCFVVTPPFENDIAFFEGLEIELGGATVRGEICYGEVLQTTLKTLPKHVRDKRERESKKRQKDRNRPIMVGSQKFVNVGAVRGKVKEIMNSRSDGEQLKPEGTDFKLIKAMLEYHPKGAEKSKGMIGIKVAKSPHGDSRCFYMLKEGGGEEDVSLKKCIDAIELDPPYVKIEKKPAEVVEKAAASTEGEAKAEVKAKADSASPAADAKVEAKAEVEAKADSAAPVADAKVEAKAEAEADSASPAAVAKVEAKAEGEGEADAKVEAAPTDE